MNDFVWQSPTKVIFGRGKERLIGKELFNNGVENVLLVRGNKSITTSGLYKRVCDDIVCEGIGIVDYPNAKPNPTLFHAEEGREIVMQEDVGAILAVGGGSVIDTAKAIAVGSKTYQELWAFFTGETIRNALPIYTISTISGSGSEVNSGAVITNEETHHKYVINSPLLYPKVSIINPELMFTVPREYSAYGAMDAFIHAIEAYVTAEVQNPLLLKGIIDALVSTITRSTHIILKEPENYEARAEFAWASMLSATGLPIKGLTGYQFPLHMIEHSLSALYNIPHGAGLAIVFSAWFKWIDCEGKDGSVDWIKSLSIPIRLSDWNIPESDIPMIAENAMGLCRLWKMDEAYTKERIEEILRLAI